jgi:FtsP/CotA-like multicopper oxidase with cupredoxin domain
LFINPLKIPKTVTGNTSLIAQNTTEALMSSSKVSVLGYGEGILGPTIRVKNGENVNINLVNKLSDLLVSSLNHTEKPNTDKQIDNKNDNQNEE